MKGLLCAECVDFRALHPSGPVECRCGNVQGWWVDPQKGIARFWARNHDTAFGFGVNNQYLRGATGVGPAAPRTNEEWRMLHDVAIHAPGYLFDITNRACWALIFKPGYTNDTSFVDERYGEAEIDAELDRRLGPVSDG